MNQYYAGISSDADYHPPHCKLTSANSGCMDVVTEWQVFNILDKLSSTATGLDQLPAWFLRLGAPVFYKPLTYLFNMSISISTVPHQWKLAAIQPVPKVPTASQYAEFRPISITPVLSKTLERIFVRKFLYPAYITLPPSLTFSDQYAFRPTGCTSAALIAILQSITDLLSNNQFVIVLALDFSKAFDTICHSTLNKMALLDIPDAAYKWLVDFFVGHEHCRPTRYGGTTSTVLDISASIIQGSAIGPASYVVNAADLTTVTLGNAMFEHRIAKHYWRYC